MPLQINRNTIIEFLFDTLPPEEMSLIADEILSNKNLKNIYEEEKGEILTHCYVDNELSPYDRIEFEDKLKTDKQLSKEIKLQKEINNSLEELNLKEALEEAYESYTYPKEHITPLTPMTYPVNRKLKNWLVAASITILFIFGGGITYHYQTRDSLENRLYARYYEPFSKNKNEYILNSSALTEAQQKYLKGDYITALLLYKNLPPSLTIETERRFFMGLSLMELGQYQKAITHFQDILLNEDYPEYNPKVKWYMALCYLKIGEKEKTINILQTIVDNNDYNYKKANQILRKLNK